MGDRERIPALPLVVGAFAVLMLIGVFLPWVKALGTWTAQGTDFDRGIAVLVLAVLMVLLCVLALLRILREPTFVGLAMFPTAAALGLMLWVHADLLNIEEGAERELGDSPLLAGADFVDVGMGVYLVEIGIAVTFVILLGVAVYRAMQKPDYGPTYEQITGREPMPRSYRRRAP